MKTNRQELIKILEAVRPGLAAKEIVEQSTSFIFMDGMVATYNDQVAVVHPADLGITGSVQAEGLYSLLKRMKGEEVEISGNEGTLNISCGRSKAGLAMIAQVSENMKAGIDQIVLAKKKWMALPANFQEAADFCLFSAGRDMTRPELTGIHIQGDVLESCDNWRASRCTLDAAMPEMLIPASALDGLAKYQPEKYCVAGGWIHFLGKEETIYSCRLLVTTGYPDISNIFEGKGDPFDLPEALPEILDRSMVFAGKGPEAKDFEVNLTVTENWLTVSVTKSTSGWFEEKTRTKYSGDPVEFVVYPNMLKEICLRQQKATLSENVLRFKGKDFVHCCSIRVMDKK